MHIDGKALNAWNRMVEMLRVPSPHRDREESGEDESSPLRRLVPEQVLGLARNEHQRFKSL